MKTLIAILITAFLAVGALAQDSIGSHFSVDASAMGFSGAGSASAASIAGGSVKLTQRVALGYEQVILPSLSANYYIGTVQYSLPLASLIGKNLNSKLVFDSSKWGATFFGGAGVIRQDLTGVQAQHIATTLGAGLNYAADGHISVQLISGQWLHGFVAGPAANQLVFTPNTAAVSTGLKLTF